MNALHRSLCAFWASSIGKKIVVAVTGAAMVLFLFAHLSGNFLIYVGPEAFNEYAKFLHEMGHGMVIWVARVGLLVTVGLHIVATVALVRQNKASRPKYAYEKTMRATTSSKLMIWSGITVLAFIVYHILHFTSRSTSQTLKDLANSGDPYAMVIAGFQAPLVSIFYVVALACLCSHLSHGIGSIFQTLGLRTTKTRGLITLGSKAASFLLFVGFASIPISIWLWGVGSDHVNAALQALQK